MKSNASKSFYRFLDCKFVDNYFTRIIQKGYNEFLTKNNISQA